jgi:hypothetical protein
MTDPREITTPEISLANGQVNPRQATGQNLSNIGNALQWSGKCGGSRNKIPPCKVTIGETDRLRRGTTELMSRNITRRSLGLNMILGLGGLHGARGVTDRLWSSPNPSQLFTPVVLESYAVPPALWGKWVYVNHANAISIINIRLELDINQDGTGSIYYASDNTEYQTNCEQVEFDQYTNVKWSTNGKQLLFTVISGNSSFDNTCDQSQNYNRSISGTYTFSSYQVSGDTLILDPWPALRLYTIDSPTNPTGPLHNALFTRATPRPGSWHNWESLGGYGVDGCAVASWAPNRLDLFMVGGDRALYHRWWDGSAWSSNWNKFDAYCVGAPAAVSWGPNRVDVFVIGGDRQCYHLSWDGQSWNRWESLGGQCEYGVAASSWTTNQLDVFVTGADQVIYRRSWTGTVWTDWQRINSTSICAPAAVAFAQNDFYVACIGPDHNLYFDNFNPSPTGWINLGPYCLDGVAASSWGPDRLDLFTIGQDGAVYQRPWEGGWEDWVNLGGRTGYGPAAISRAPNIMDLFVIGADHALYHKAFW